MQQLGDTAGKNLMRLRRDYHNHCDMDEPGVVVVGGERERKTEREFVYLLGTGYSIANIDGGFEHVGHKLDTSTTRSKQ